MFLDKDKMKVIDDIKKVTCLLFFVIWMVTPVFVASCKAQGTGQVVPDFKGYFEALRNSRTAYNLSTDSLFLIQDKNAWISMVKRRIHMTHQLYEANDKRRQSLEEACRDYRGEIPVKAFADLFDYFYNQTYAKQQDLDNPLTLLAVCKVFDYGGQRVLDSLKCINVIQAWKLYSYCKLWNLGSNREYLQKAYECGKFLLSDEARKYPYYDYALSQAFRYIPKTIWVKFHVQSIDEYWECCHKLGAFLSRPDIHEVLSPSLYAELRKNYDTAEESLVRNIYQPGDNNELISKEVGDSLMADVVKRNLASASSLSCLSYIRTQYMMMDLHQITANQARAECLRRYRINWEKIKNKRLNSTELNDYLQPFYTFFYLNYKAMIPFEEKRKTVVDMCHDIERVYKNRLNHEGTTDYVRDLIYLTTYDKVSMYLTPEEVAKFLSTMNVASQATTYAHSVISAEMAEAIMKEILRFKPELLIGQLGCTTVDEVKRKSKDFVQLIRDAALYHDIGMNSVASVTKSEFRPMFDEERAIYECHPEYGLVYLKLTPGLQHFKDITLGHHKWYNGKGGYPESFDNTKSPSRILIDIVSLSDGIRSTARQMALNHPSSEVADAVLSEIKANAGTQYNPELVGLLLNQKDLTAKVRKFVDTGWADAYYEVFKKNFFDRD